MNKTIAVFGCGWLGLPLAKSLQPEGFKINGSTTSFEKKALLKENNISPFLVDLNADDYINKIDIFLKNAEILIINIPPRMKTGDSSSYFEKMEVLYKRTKLSTVRKIIFVSSTSVYGNITGDVTEKTTPKPVTESAKQLLDTEHLFLNDSTLKSTIIRFGGLIGNGRHPINHLIKKEEISNGNHPVNLIHITDCIRIIKLIISKEYWGEIFNAVYPNHPSKETYYTTIAKKRGFKKPLFANNNKKYGKKIISENLISVKFFDFNTSI